MKKILIVLIAVIVAISLLSLVKIKEPKEIVIKEKTSLKHLDKELKECMYPRWKNELYESEALLTFNINVHHLTNNVSDKLLLDTEKLDSLIITNLNTYFKEVGFRFKLKESNIFISDNTIGSYVDYAESYTVDNSINLIIYHFRKEEEYINGVALRSPGNEIAVNLNALLEFKTLAHEMGHAFGLPHIFEKDDTDGKNTFNGDQICDTPAFSIMDNRFISGCEWNGDLIYSEEDLKKIIPNFQNYNSELTECRDRFTTGQILVMRWYVTNTPVLKNAIIF